MTETTPEPQNPPPAQAAPAAARPENPKKGMEEYFNKALLFAGFLVWFGFAWSIFPIEVTILIGVVVFIATVFYTLFPGVKKFHQQLWFQNSWITLVLFLLILPGSILLAFQVEKRSAAVGNTPTPTVTVQSTAVSQAQATPTLAPTVTLTPTTAPEATATPEPTASAEPILSLSLPVIQSFGFEDEQELDPWISVPNNKFGREISGRYAHTGNQSQALILAIQGRDSGEYGGVGLNDKTYKTFNERSVASAEAWVMVPETPQSAGKEFYMLMVGISYSRDGEYLQTSSREIKLKPGKWIRIFWGAAYSAVLYDQDGKPVNRFLSPDRELTEFYITVWCSQPYSGLVYFDDLTFYAEE